jgi:putative nucleotidyltransferase with HDIG domain
MSAVRAASAVDKPGRSGGGDPSGWVAAALEAALRARAPGVHASTPMVRQLAVKIGQSLGLDAESAALLDMSARVRDVGMIALPDAVALAKAPLSAAEWALVNQHPAIGAELLEGLDVAASAADVVRAHHERWDGGGYPDGRSGDAIPLLSRVIATCDAFVAMASDRPHRRGIGAEAALEQIWQARGSQFDPRMVDALVGALTAKGSRRAADDGSGTAAAAADRGRTPPAGTRAERRDLSSVIAELDPLPAFAPACDRLLAAIRSDRTTGGELVTLIETDTGLTVAILRRAQGVAARRPIANVADAVAALSPAEIAQLVEALPHAEFPWRVTPLDVLMHHSRVHAQAVARAADRIVQAVQPEIRDDVLAAALLHDIGKLLLGRARSGYADASDARKMPPEERIHHEQRSLGMDHASLGGLLLRRWGLPERLTSAVGAHHSSEGEREVATYVRLADMVAHHAQGEAVDRSKMLRLAELSGLSADALRDVLFELPHAGGSQRRRADPSPLSSRETDVLRLLAHGKVYKTIASDLGLSTSTVRTHLHNTYAKLAVEDRAQAVLRATEMGWI